MRPELRLVLVVLLAGSGVAACGFGESPTDSMRRGDTFAAAGKHAEATVEYRNAVRADEKNGEARYKLAQSLKAAGDLAAAVREYIIAADLLQGRTDVQLDGARAMLAVGRFEDARAKVDAVLVKEPGNADAHVIRGHATIGLRDLPQAQSDLEKALSVKPDEETALVDLGTVLWARGRAQQAEASYKQALVANPRSSSAHLALANFYMAEGRLAETEQMLKGAAAVAPENVGVHQSLARFYLMTQRAAEAEAPLRAAAERATDGQPKLNLADYYVALRRNADAVTILQQLAGDPVASLPARTRLAGIHYEEGRRDEAHAMIDELRAAEPTNARLTVVKSRWLLAERKTDQALEIARLGIKLDPQSAECQFALGTALLARGRTEEATKAYVEALRLNPSASDAAMSLATVYMETGRATEALQFSEQAVRLQPRSGNARFLLARNLLASGDAKRAATELDLVFQVAPERLDVKTLLGRIRLALGSRSDAERQFTEVLAKDPAHHDALAEMVQLDVRDRQVARARTRVESALGKNGTDGKVLVLAARVFNTAGDAKAAEAALRKAIQVSPTTLEAFSVLGQLFIQQNRLPEAIREYESLATQLPEDIGINTMIAMLLQVQGDMGRARKHYEAVLALNSNSAIANNNLAYMNAEAGTNLDVALSMAQVAKANAPDDPNMDDTLGWVYVKRGAPELALAPLRQAVAKEPTNGTFLYHLGVAYANLGRVADAREAFARALKTGADFEGASDARKLLAGLPAR